MLIMRIYEPKKGSLSEVNGKDFENYTSLVDRFEKIGANIKRYNLDDNSSDFDDNKVVTRFISENGEEVLPIVMVNNEVVITRRYPSETEFYELLFPDSDLDGIDDFGDEGCGCGSGSTCSC